jgi:hypothetical protein
MLAGLLAGPAMAQQSRSDSGQFEEIVVTAEKRETTVQTTAISRCHETGTLWAT